MLAILSLTFRCHSLSLSLSLSPPPSLQMRNKNLVQSIMEEDEAILNLKVKLKVLPLSKELQVEEQD